VLQGGQISMNASSLRAKETGVGVGTSLSGGKKHNLAQDGLPLRRPSSCNSSTLRTQDFADTLRLASWNPRL
jgi:hypothetical protein